MHATHILVGSVEASDPTTAAHLALNVNRRSVGEEVRERGRRVAGDAKGQGDNDPGLVELGILEVTGALWRGS